MSRAELKGTTDRVERALQAERIRNAASRLALDRTAAAETAPPLSASADEADAPPEQPAPPSPAEYMANLGSSFAGEAVDPQWSWRAAELVSARLAAEGDRSLRSIECHTSMCRIVTDDAGRDAASRSIRATLGEPGDEVWSGALFSRVERADGRSV